MSTNIFSDTIYFRKNILTIVATVLALGFFSVAHAATPMVVVPTSPQFTLEALPDMINYHDFVVGPGKIELQIAPGGSQTVDLTVANRLGSDKVFSITEEDFKGSNDPNQSVILLGSDRGPYSIKDDIRIHATTVKIPFGQKARIPITISIPADAQPGGLYGSVLVSVVSVEGSTTPDGVGATNPVVTRIGTLFFVRIPGPVSASGSLSSFSLPHGSFIWSSSISHTDPITFDILFKNDGNVYVDPSGTISVTNIWGAPIETISVEPWFAMPQSLRFREVQWQPMFLFGRYNAHVKINPGFGTSSDVADVVFWVIPWKILLMLFIVLICLITGVRWIIKHVSFIKK